MKQMQKMSCSWILALIIFKICMCGNDKIPSNAVLNKVYFNSNSTMEVEVEMWIDCELLTRENVSEKNRMLMFIFP